MPTWESRLQRGRRRGRELVRSRVADLRTERIGAGISQAALAKAAGIAPAQVSRLEGDIASDVTVVRLAEIASLLGMELSVGLHPIGDPIRDKGQQALGKRFDGLLADAWQVTNETLLPMAGDQRAWDKLLRLKADDYRVGVDLETRIRDIQALTRRTRMRERDGGVDVILVVLADTATNRQLAVELRASLGQGYETQPREILAALRAGRRLNGSGVILV